LAWQFATKNLAFFAPHSDFRLAPSSFKTKLENLIFNHQP